MLQIKNSKVNTATNATLLDVIALTSVTGCDCTNTISPTFITSTDQYCVSGDATATGTGSQINLTPTYDANNDIAQSWADTYLVGKGWNGGNIVAFAYYDDAGGGLTISPPLITSTATVFGAEVTLTTQSISPNFIVSTLQVYAPELLAAQLIDPNLIGASNVVYNPDVVTGAVVLTPEYIPSSSVVYSPELIKLLQEIDAAPIGSTVVVYGPTVLGGDSIVIPIESRQTWNAVAAYLRQLSTAFQGSDNDVIVAWLRSEGLSDQYNDMWDRYLNSLGYLNSNTDKYAAWRQGQAGTNWILRTGFWDDSGNWVDEADWKDEL